MPYNRGSTDAYENSVSDVDPVAINSTTNSTTVATISTDIISADIVNSGVV